MNSEPNVKQGVPFFAVANMDESVHFYVDGLGFQLTRTWIVDGKLCWCYLEIGEAGLMLQEFPREGHNAFVPEGKVGVGVSIYFICEDALAIYHRARAHGIAASRPFVGNAMWVTGVDDPDGYHLFFESDTDAPEESEYSEKED